MAIVKHAIAGLVLGLMPSMAAAGQPTCGTRDSIVDQLKVKFKETHRASGLESDTKMIEIWTSETSGSWTILVTQASGVSCIAAAGRNWLDMPGLVVVDDTAS